MWKYIIIQQQGLASLDQDHQIASTNVGDVHHVLPFKYPEPQPIWKSNILIMSLRDGNASVALPSSILNLITLFSSFNVNFEMYLLGFFDSNLDLVPVLIIGIWKTKDHSKLLVKDVKFNFDTEIEVQV